MLMIGCEQSEQERVNKMEKLVITSSAFQDNMRIPDKYTAYADNLSPGLRINNIPRAAKSLVVIMDDPDAQRVVGHTWDHWVMWNIPLQGTIAENTAPGIQGAGSNGKNAYYGPRPPAGSGVHHYIFKVYAIDTLLVLPKTASRADVEKAMKGHVLAEGKLTGLYSV